MGYKFVKHLESANYNRKLFFLDRGAIDLPPIVNLTDIMPGSEARSLSTGEKWVLNTHYKWVWIGTGDCCCSGGGASTDDGETIVPGEEPVIEGISLTPMNITVGLGATVAFSASIKGNPSLTRGITWTIKGQKSANTKISADGILTIGVNEMGKTITVRATAQGDTSVYAQAVVTVDESIEDLDPIVTAIEITPSNVEVIRGRAVMFTVKVSGANITDNRATFTVKNQTSNSTYFDENGVLYVGSDEMSDILIVTATSNLDPNVSTTAVINTIAVNDAENPMVVTSVQVIPETVTVGQGFTSQLAAVIHGEANPPQDVVWKVMGNTSNATRITANGLLTIGEDEQLGAISVLAYSTYAPDIYGECDVTVIAKDDPVAAKRTVTAVIINPDLITMEENSLKVFSAVVIGNNAPDQAVTWEMTGANVATTYITDAGAVVIGKGETAKTLTVKATSVQDPSKFAYAYISIAEVDMTEFEGIPEVPEAPLGAKYLRQRFENGETGWVQVIEKEEIEEPTPEISAIDIEPESLTVAPGSVITYTAKMAIVGDLSDEVTWSIKGNNAAGTVITADGILSISADETSKLITVRATSVVDTTKTGRATVAVDKEAPLLTKVTGVKVIPNKAEIIRGRAMRFQAVITGVNLNNQDVNWSIMGQNNIDTVISENGILSVSDVESASVIIVTATSKTDESFSGTCVVSVIPEELATDVYEIHGVTIMPDGIKVGQGYSARLAAVVNGINNPPQDVIWEVLGTSSAATHVSQDGELYVGVDEDLDGFTVLATAVYAPDITATSIVTVLPATTPEIDKTTIVSIIVTPEMIEAAKGDKITFDATVLGNNNPPQEVTWALSGNNSANTIINKLGVLTIGADETSKVLTIRCTSKVDTNIYALSYVTISEALTTPETGIPDVPEAPLNKDYIRRRDQSGKAIWVEHIAPEGFGRGGYLGTYDNKADMDARLVFPDGASEGDFCIISHDETHGSFPSIWTAVGKPGNLHMEFDVVLGRPFRLGDKLDILNVLDNGVHASNKFREIDVLDDFDTNDVRWELHECPSAWKLVTELHPGFWNMIKHNPDRFKALIGMDRHTGAVKMYLTCFTDNHEFAIPVYTEDIENPRPINNNLSWSNTIMNGYNFVAANEHEFIQYGFDPNNFTLSILQQNLLPEDVVPGVSPWATVIGEYTMLVNGEIIGPLANVTDSTGYLWVSNSEHFMIGSAGDGTQMFCYSIDTEDWFIFDVPAGSKANYQLATDLNERYFMMFIDDTHAVWGDRITHKTKQVIWKPTGYSGLSTPTHLTMPSISVDGKYYLHTSTNNVTPMFSTFDFDTGDFISEAPRNGTSSSAIGLSDGKRVFTNTPEGLITLWNISSDGSLSVRHQETPFKARYVVHPTGFANQLMLAKVEDKADCPVWFIYDCDQEKVIAQSAFTAPWCDQTNPQGKGCTYRVDTPAGPRYLLTYGNGSGNGLILEYKVDGHEGVWNEYSLPFGGLNNDKSHYHQPLLLNEGQILVTTDKDGNPHGYDMINHEVVDLSDFTNPGETDGDNNVVQIDDNHMAWCTHEGITIYRIEENGDRTEVISIPEQQGVVMGFGQRPDTGE